MRWTAMVAALALAGGAACESAEGADAGDVPSPDLPADPGTDPGPDVPVFDPGPRDPGEDESADVPPDPPVDVPADVPADVPVPDPGQDNAPVDVPADPGPGPGPCGFTLRVPGLVTVPFEAFPGDPASTQEMPQIDHVCTFDHGGHQGCFYVQASPTTCAGMMGCTYVTDGFWTSFDGVVTGVAGAAYDFGGNHHNDSVTFQVFGTKYKAYHSSFGFGWRKCQPMDCLQVFGEDPFVPVTDGCGCDRTIPISCVEVKDANPGDPFAVVFQPCNGDPCLE